MPLANFYLTHPFPVSTRKGFSVRSRFTIKCEGARSRSTRQCVPNADNRERDVAGELFVSYMGDSRSGHSPHFSVIVVPQSLYSFCGRTFVYGCGYRKRSNYSARKKIHPGELCKMLSFPDGAVIRVALPNWSECTSNARSRTFTRSGNSKVAILKRKRHQKIIKVGNWHYNLKN